MSYVQYINGILVYIHIYICAHYIYGLMTCYGQSTIYPGLYVCLFHDCILLYYNKHILNQSQICLQFFPIIKDTATKPCVCIVSVSVCVNIYRI